MRTIDEAIIHCSDTFADMDTTAADIDRWHKAKGWRKIGYHFVVRRSGAVEKGRDVNEVGSHCYGHNENSVGICLIGGRGADGLPEDNFTPEQIANARELVRQLKMVHPILRVVGHNYYNKAKACPCFDVTKIL